MDENQGLQVQVQQPQAPQAQDQEPVLQVQEPQVQQQQVQQQQVQDQEHVLHVQQVLKIPTQGGIQNLYIVRVIMSSGHNVEESRSIGDFIQETTYRFDKDTRKKVAAIRMKHKAPLYENSVDFHGLWICREGQIIPIMHAVREANKELQSINTILGADSEFIPLSTSEIAKGELYSKIVESIRYRVFKDVFDRISEVMENKTYLKKAELTQRTKDSLINLCDQLHTINLLNDDDITKKIEDIRQKIESNTLAPLKKELDDAIKGIQVKSRWTALSLT